MGKPRGLGQTPRMTSIASCRLPSLARRVQRAVPPAIRQPPSVLCHPPPVQRLPVRNGTAVIPRETMRRFDALGQQLLVSR